MRHKNCVINQKHSEGGEKKTSLLCHAHEGQGTTLRSQFSPSTVGSRDQSQTIRFVWKVLLPTEPCCEPETVSSQGLPYYEMGQRIRMIQLAWCVNKCKLARDTGIRKREKEGQGTNTSGQGPQKSRETPVQGTFHPASAGGFSLPFPPQGT